MSDLTELRRILTSVVKKRSQSPKAMIDSIAAVCGEIRVLADKYDAPTVALAMLYNLEDLQENLLTNVGVMDLVDVKIITEPEDVVRGMSMAAEVAGALEARDQGLGEKRAEEYGEIQAFTRKLVAFVDSHDPKKAVAFFALLSMLIFAAEDGHKAMTPKERAPGRVM